MGLFDILMTAVLVVIAGLYYIFVSRPKSRIQKKISGLSPKFVEATNNGSAVIMRLDDYEKAEGEYTEAVHRGEKKPYDDIRFFVTPAFVFWLSESSRNFMQVGGDGEYKRLCKRLVLEASGLTEKELWLVRSMLSGWDGEWDLVRTLERLLIKRTTHVYVPYTNSVLPREKQAAMYPKYSNDRVYEYLLRGTPLPN